MKCNDPPEPGGRSTYPFSMCRILFRIEPLKLEFDVVFILCPFLPSLRLLTGSRLSRGPQSSATTDMAAKKQLQEIFCSFSGEAISRALELSGGDVTIAAAALSKLTPVSGSFCWPRRRFLWVRLVVPKRHQRPVSCSALNFATQKAHIHVAALQVSGNPGVSPAPETAAYAALYMKQDVLASRIARMFAQRLQDEEERFYQAERRREARDAALAREIDRAERRAALRTCTHVATECTHDAPAPEEISPGGTVGARPLGWLGLLGRGG